MGRDHSRCYLQTKKGVPLLPYLPLFRLYLRFRSHGLISYLGWNTSTNFIWANLKRVN